MLAKDAVLSKDFARNIMKEELKRIIIKGSKLLLRHRNTGMGAGGLASAFPTIDLIGYNVKQLVKTIHLGDYAEK